MKLSSVVVAAAVSATALAAKDEPVTVTTTFYGSTDTHRYGRFDKTTPASTPSSSGTHKYGKFDKTKPESISSETGTHKYGKFDKTKNPVTTTVFVTGPSGVNFAVANGTNGSAGGKNGTSGGKNGSNGSSSSTDNGAAAVGSGAMMGFAGAVAAGLLLI